MTRNLVRRVALAAALAASLTLADPAHAAGPLGWTPQTNFFQAAWHWAASLWAPPALPAPRVVGSTKTEHAGGAAPTGTPSSATGSCQVNCERGGGIDPNG